MHHHQTMAWLPTHRSSHMPSSPEPPTPPFLIHFCKMMWLLVSGECNFSPPHSHLSSTAALTNGHTIQIWRPKLINIYEFLITIFWLCNCGLTSMMVVVYAYAVHIFKCPLLIHRNVLFPLNISFLCIQMECRNVTFFKWLHI